jgi:hypothetical protein
MRTLDPDLTVAQKLAPLIDYASGAGTPKAKVEAWNQRGGAVICDWTSLYAPTAITSGDRLELPIVGGIALDDELVVGMQIYPARARALTSITLRLKREGTLGNQTLVIKALDEDGAPTGADLRTSTVDCSAITTAAGGEWVTFSFTNLARSADVQYCWLLRASNDHHLTDTLWIFADDVVHTYLGCSLFADADEEDWAVLPGFAFPFIGSNTGPVDQSAPTFHASAMSDIGTLYRIAKWASSDHLHFTKADTPTAESIFTDWQDLAVHCTAAAISCEGEYIVIVYVDPTDSYHIWEYPASGYGEGWGEPIDLGFVSDANGVIAITNKSSTVYGMVWTIAHEVHAARRTSAVWGANLDSNKSLSLISGIAVAYQGDFNIVVTGIDATSHDGVWQHVWGDDYSMGVDTFSTFTEIMAREPGEDFLYYAPSLTFADMFRLFFVERHAGTTAGYRQYWTRTGSTVDFIDCLWLEPVPFNSVLPAGMALCNETLALWLSTPSSVSKAELTEIAVALTDDLLEVNMNIKPGTNRSTLTIVLDNTSGKYNGFNYKGWTIAPSLGFTTYSGIKYSTLPYFWITGWEFCSPPWFPLRAFWPQGVIGTLKIYCEGAWEFLNRWKARKKYSWVAGDKSIFQLMNWIICRAGLEFSSWSTSDAVVNYEPDFEIAAGSSGKLALKKLLGWVEDVPVLRDGTIYLKYPEADDPSVYIYHSTWQNNYPDGLGGVTIDHLVYRGNYGVGMWKPNMAQIDTDLLHVEAFAWDEINAYYDRMNRVTAPEYTSAADASRRGTRELRRGEIWGAYTGWCQVPVNCGQEEFDVITITDVAGGVTGILRRVLGIETTWKKVDGSYFQKLLLGAV